MIMLQCLAYVQSNDSFLRQLQVIFGIVHFLHEEIKKTVVLSAPSSEHHRGKA